MIKNIIHQLHIQQDLVVENKNMSILMEKVN